MILITGGARSGKSAFSEKLAKTRCEQVLYIATSIITDSEMATRVARHQVERPAHWRTWEGFQQLGDVIRQQVKPGEGVIVECITTLIANLLFEQSGGESPETLDFAPLETFIEQQMTDLIDASKRCRTPVYMVTNELGMGITPENRLARHFVDIAGRANQRLAAAADEVWLVVSGIGVRIK